MAERRIERTGQTMFKKKLGFLLGVMVLLSVAGYLVCLALGSEKRVSNDESFLLVTSFYPMYILAENVTAEVEGMEVSNLTENQTGCLHDYVVSPRDMRRLDEADAFLINGADMELFMEKIMKNSPELPVIEASYGISLLEGIAHHHEAEDIDHEPEHESGHEEDSHGEHTHVHAKNGHVWMDVERYRKQLATVTKELQVLMPERAEDVSKAATVYDNKLAVLAEGVKDLKDHTKGIHVVIFHEAFAYLAESLGLEVLMALSLDEETLPSPGEIAEVIEEINYHGSALVLIEEEYASYAEKITAETDAKVVYINPLTTGDGAADSYLSGMWENLSAIRQVVE